MRKAAAIGLFLFGAFSPWAHGVVSSFHPDGTHVQNSWFRTAGDMYSGTVSLSNGCSGTLIATNAILTAGHCVGQAATAYFISDEANQYSGGFTGIAVTDFVSHPRWTGKVQESTDLAIAFLSAPAPVDARISKLFSDPLGRQYSGTVFMGGYGLTRHPDTGAAARVSTRFMGGVVDGRNAAGFMPNLHVGSNLISVPANNPYQGIGRSDLDLWIPSRPAALGDDRGFTYFGQKSSYGYQMHLTPNGIAFTPGGYIPFAQYVEAVTSNGDSGSAVFFNPHELVKSYFWHIRYDQMLANGGVPTPEMLGVLDDLYADDSNYIVGVTSFGSPGAQACPLEPLEAKRACINAAILAGIGSTGYELIADDIDWIASTVASRGGGVQIGRAGSTDGSVQRYEADTGLAFFLDPVPVDYGIQLVPVPPTNALLIVPLAFVLGSIRAARRRALGQ